MLALAGALASDVFFEDVAAQPVLDGVRLVAATLPGYAGTPSPEDDSVEAFAAQAYDAAAELGAGGGGRAQPRRERRDRDGGIGTLPRLARADLAQLLAP